jgi:hypothetical protein
MEQGMGWLRWSAEQFWAATLDELTHAIVGFGEARGVKADSELPLPEEDYDRLIAMVDAEAKKEAAQ